MKRIRIIKTTFFLFISSLLFQNVNAQHGGVRNAILQTMQGIYKSYDSVKYLSFDVRFNYGSDTLLGKFDNEEMHGQYTLAGRKAKYRLGDIDFLQNDSFFLAIYNKDKLMLVDEPKTSNMGSQLPMRSQIDSLLEAYSQQYFMSIDTTQAENSSITLIKTDTLAQLNLFSLQFDNITKLITKIRYEFNEPAELDSTVLASLRAAAANDTLVPVQKKKFSIHFSNYRLDNYDEAVYDEGNYIWFENNVCKPVAKYEDYKIYYTKPQKIFVETVPE
ncbi:MAG: hypothetical protein EOO13_01695 [Chitinophagaceae bacterium]|nr:MAG: hypothetical protein EOO13_01695 [Chitinophagaceae bacterium]